MTIVLDSNLARPQNAIKWPQVLVACTATFAIFISGFHTGWPSPSLPKLLSDEFPFDISNDEAANIVIMGFVGNVIGGLVGSAFIDRIGRKPTILFITVPQLLGWLLVFMSYYLKWLLYVARVIGGLAEGASLTIIPLYLSEIAEPSMRGILSSFSPSSNILGMLFVNIVGSLMSIKYTAVVCFCFPFIFLILSWRLPETPYYYLMKGRAAEAEKVLKLIRRKTSVSEELASLTKDVNRQMSESGKYSDIFSIDSNRKAFFITCGARIFQQTTGIAAYMQYLQILVGLTTSVDPPISSSAVYAVQALTTLVTSFFADRWGRKPLLLLSSIACFVNLLLQSVYFILKEYMEINVSVVDWFPLVMLIILIISFTVGFGTAVTILAGELFSASIKSKTASLINIVFALGMMGVTKFYQATSDQFGMTVPFSSFTACTFLSIFFFYFCLPETKGKTLEQIQQQLKGNSNSKKFDHNNVI